MIQRIQHVFMFLSALGAFLSAYWTFQNTEWNYAGPCALLFLSTGLTAMINIFLYSRIRIQKKIQFFHLFLTDLSWILFFILLYIEQKDWIPHLNILIVMIASSVFSALAVVFIVKDIKLLESVDRIR